jgi:hypothetical protein
MRKQFKKQKEESQIEWKNTTHDAQFSPMKKWYGVIKVGDKNFITEYESKFRSEVTALFQEEARLSGGTLTTVGVFK